MSTRWSNSPKRAAIISAVASLFLLIPINRVVTGHFGGSNLNLVVRSMIAAIIGSIVGSVAQRRAEASKAGTQSTQ